MSFLFCLLLGLSGVASADARLELAPAALNAWASADFAGEPSFQLRLQERVLVLSRNDDVLKIRIKRAGKLLTGFVRADDWALSQPANEGAREGWLIGLGGVFTQYQQNGKSFQSKDQVHYTTSAVTSQGLAPMLYAQSGRADFWRVFFGLRATDFKGTARTDVIGAPDKSLRVRHQLAAFGLERAWMPFSNARAFFCGLGAEAARALSIKITFDGSELPTSSADLPFYFGGHALFGGQWALTSHLDLVAEGRVGGYGNAAPMILQYEAGVSLMWWL